MSRTALVQLRRLHRLVWLGLWSIGLAKCAIAVAVAVGLAVAAYHLPGLPPRLWQAVASCTCLATILAATHRWLWPLWRAEKSLHATAAALERSWQNRQPPSPAASPAPRPPVGSLLALIDLDQPNSTIADPPLREAARREAQRYWHGPLTSGALLAVWRILGWSSLGVALWVGLISLIVAWPQHAGRPAAAILGLGVRSNAVPGGAEHGSANRNWELAESDWSGLSVPDAGPPDRSSDLAQGRDDGADYHTVWDPRQLEAWWQMQRWLNQQTEQIEQIANESDPADPTRPAAARLRLLSRLQLELADQLERAAQNAAGQHLNSPVPLGAQQDTQGESTPLTGQ